MTEITERRPIQVFLDTGKFLQFDERPGGGGSKDFYAGNNNGFALHKGRIRQRISSISQALRAQKQPAGFIRVTMREDALGKSYRPLGSLFKRTNNFAFVGADRIGEMVFQVTPDALSRLDHLIEERAELTPRRVLNESTGEIEERVSGYRAEVGAIDSIELYDAADRLSFSLDEALAWVSQPGVVGSYIVEFFRPDREVAPAAIQSLTSALLGGLRQLPSGVRVRGLHTPRVDHSLGEAPLAVTVDLLTDKSIKDIRLPALGDAQAYLLADHTEGRRPQRDFSPDHHAALLDFLAEQTLVRSIDLPPIIEAAPAAIGATAARPTLPSPAADVDYPVVGIIDGGVANLGDLSPWRVGHANLTPTADRDETHGTFIAGLVAGGAVLNPHLADYIERNGCKFYDLDMFPKRELRQSYYGSDLEYFFDLLDEKIKEAKRVHRVRVFNLSFGVRMATSRFGYTPIADRLDRMARENDVLLVVSAGNLQPGTTRQPWSKDAVAVTTMLAGLSGNQQIYPPAEQFFGLTVGALNPPGVSGHESDLPTTYTRRGPGAGGSRKPDLAHYGGVEPSAGTSNKTGLASLEPAGTCTESCGTSFAAPVAAATVATLDHRLAQAASRETLLALPVHRASRAKPLMDKTLRHISREFVGFGMPPTADVILADDPHAITLLFSEVLHAGRKLEFPFAWPAALTSETGSCRGQVDVTIAYTPPIDAAHRDEAMRVELEAHLYQEAIDPDTLDTKWESRLVQDGAGVPQGMPKTERYLLMTGLKWSPIKRYSLNMKRGRGHRSNWKLGLTSLTRAGGTFPSTGVPFTIALTISDPTGAALIHDEVRNTLQRQGLTLADITVAHRVRPRG